MIPRRFSAHVDDPAQPFTLDLMVVTGSEHRPQVVSLELSMRNLTEPGSITTERLRSVQVAKALQQALRKATKPVIDKGDGTFTFPDDSTGTSWGGQSVARPVRGEPMSEDFLRLVADTYRMAVANGSRQPVEDMRAQIGWGSRSTAGRWVVQARKAGLLGPAIGRTAGEAPASTRKKKGRRS